MSKKRKIVLGVTIVICAALIYTLLLPPLVPLYLESLIAIHILALITVYAINQFKEFSLEGAIVSLVAMGKAIIIMLAIDIILFLISWLPLVHWGTRYNQLTNGNEANIETVEYQELIESIDTSQLPVIDEETAKILAESKLGSDAALGSVFRIGDGSKVDVSGTIYWIFQLEHSGFFEWLSHPASPGYISVNASNASDVEFHKGYNILYSPSSFFGHDTWRHVRFSGNLANGLTEYTFEVNDDWEPLEVITTYKNLTGCMTPEATGVTINNPQTGEVVNYGLTEVPEWVDIVQPESFIEDQIDNRGKYIHGIINPGNKDETKKTKEMLSVYKDNDCYYFTGLTSMGEDEALTGFALVNTRTKKVFKVKMGGITETRAMDKAKDMWDDYGYYAIEPLPINIDGVPTYAVPVKSESSRVITGYSLVCIHDESISAKGDSLKDAARAYSKKLSSVGVYAASDKAYKYDLTGVIIRIHSEIQDGDTYYSFVLSDDMTKIFTAGYPVSNELVVTEVGDEVTFTYVDDGNGTFTVVKFDNHEVSTIVSENQKNRDEADVPANDDIEIPTVNPEENADWWNSLTDEERTEIMEQSSKE